MNDFESMHLKGKAEITCQIFIFFFLVFEREIYSIVTELKITRAYKIIFMHFSAPF